MVKETQQRLIKALKILREPSGSTVPAIVQVVNKDEPRISLKDIVKTLQGCLKTGVMTRCRDRIRLKNSVKSMKKNEDPPLERTPSLDKMNNELSYHQPNPLPGEPIKIKQKCGPKAKPKAAKPKPKCPKPAKPKAKAKPKCPKPKAKKKAKPKVKCPKPKQKGKPPKPKKPKIQPYCKKPPKPKACPEHSNMSDF